MLGPILGPKRALLVFGRSFQGAPVFHSMGASSDSLWGLSSYWGRLSVIMSSNESLCQAISKNAAALGAIGGLLGFGVGRVSLQGAPINPMLGGERR